MINVETYPTGIDPRELDRQRELSEEIARGNQFAAGELQFRKVQVERGLNYDQIESAIESFFACPF